MLDSQENDTISQEQTPEDQWSARGDYWLKRINPVPQYKARKRRKISKPLVLSGHGIRLNVHCGTLLIKCGFSHYPQKREEYRFFPKDRQLPSRIVILDGDGSISFDALEWLSEQDVPLVQIDWRGEIVNVGAANYAADTKLVKRQLEIKESEKGFEFSKWLILKKIQNSYDTIKHISNNSAEAQPMLTKIKEQATRLKKNMPDNLPSLLAVEGNAAAAYFRYWYTLSLKWRGLGKKPVPQEWLCIGTRIGNTGKNNQFSVHPVNSILNYAYGVLENQVKGQILASGADPTIGYLHASGSERLSLIFDLMEPARPIMDKKILEFVLNRTFSPDDFVLNKKGICRLHPQFARYVVKTIQDVPEIDETITNTIRKLFS